MPPLDFLSIDSGPVQARINKTRGHLEVAGPPRGAGANAAQSNVISFDPATAVVGGNTVTLGKVLSSSPVPGGLELVQQFGGRQVRARLTFRFPAVARYEVTDWGGPAPDRTSVSAKSDAGEHFYGFGEKFNALDQAGRVVEMLVFDNPGAKGDRSYKVVPWFISTRGYGFHLDSPARSQFDMRAAANGRYTVTNQVGTLAFNVVYGPALTDVLSRYTAFSGRPPLPPPFAFGPWISSDVWRDGGEVRYAVETFRKRGIPVSGFVFDSPWETAYNDFTFNIGDQTTQFGHAGTFEGKSFNGFATLAEMMTFFARNGLKVICWMTPFVNVSSVDEKIRGQNLGEAKPAGKDPAFFVKDGTTGKPLTVRWWKGVGSPIDFTSTAARDWLTQRLRALVSDSAVGTSSGGTESAIGGFKTDDGEFGNGTDVYIPDDARYANGKAGREFVNGYCLEYHRTVYSVLGEKGLLFARSGFAGAQAFPGCWAGDNEPNFGQDNGLPSVIVAGLSAAMCGFSVWGHDVGGYQNTHFSPVSPADLFIRWTQFGCFSPIMQMHRQVDGGNLRQYPWGYAEAGETADHNRALDNFRFYATLHTRLFPYLYTAAQQSAQTGLPILRPLVLIHPDDPRTFAVRHTYYFGRDLLVAPVITPNTDQRDLYLPEGDWFDFWTGEQHAGKQDLHWSNPAQPAAPASKIPVFVKAGGIVPMLLGDDVQTLCDTNYVNNPAVRTWAGDLDVRIYPADGARLTVFDGTVIACGTSGGATTVDINSPAKRTILLRIRAAKPQRVTRDGTDLPKIAAGTLNGVAEGWQSDGAANMVLVKFSQGAGSTRITF